MDQIKFIMDTQLTEGEMMVFMLVESGMAYNDLAKRLMTNTMRVKRLHESASKKLDKMGKIFQTPVDKKQ